VAACAQIGDVSGTEKALSKLVALRPDLTLNKVANLYGYKTPARQEHLVTALRKAGLPE
jgi:adenylate cyclase